MSYTEFMRGKYDPTDHPYVLRLLQNMTFSELEALRSQSFEMLWSRMWNHADKHEHEMPFAKEKFMSVSHLLNSANSDYSEPEWGFPKGRRYRCESDVQCAQREFFEETNIPRSAYILVKDVEFRETFLGTNGIPYEHKYFLAILTQPSQFNLHQKFTCIQKREISAIGWKTMRDCMMLTRPHYTGREEMLLDFSSFVGTVEVRIPNIPAVDNGNTCT
jgi:8-oxo-dGTP pyrophosphatase MutT (NUDIX family)